MADAASTIIDYFPKGQIGYISVLANISSDCDCAGSYAPAPRIHDIGILASTDPVAIDKACLDLIKSNVDTGTNDLLSQITRLNGENTLTVSEKIGIGTQDYNLIEVEGNSNGNTGNNNNGNENTDNNGGSEDEDEDEVDVLSGNMGQIPKGNNYKLNLFLFCMLILVL